MKRMFLASGALSLASVGPRIHSTGNLSHWKILVVLGVLVVVLISIVALSRSRRDDEAATRQASGESQVIGRFPPLTDVAAPATTKTGRDAVPVVHETESLVGESSQKKMKA
jgi:putative exporter of polyketide antibiotics